MDDLTVLLISAAAIGAGVFLVRNASQAPLDRAGLGATSPSRIIDTSEEGYAHLGTYPVGQVPSSRQLAERLVAQGTFRPRDVEPLATAIEARRYAIPQTAGPYTLYPYRANGHMVDIGWVARNGQQEPLSYVYYPVGGSQAEGFRRPI